MRYNEIIESVDDDDDLFGRGEHHRFADAIRAQAEEDQRVADEERGCFRAGRGKHRRQG